MSGYIVRSNTNADYFRISFPNGMEYEMTGKMDGESYMIMNQINKRNFALFNNAKIKKASISGFVMSNCGFSYEGVEITPTVDPSLDDRK